MYVGLDVHKRFDQACVMNKSGMIVQEQKFLNTKEELDKFLESLPKDSKIAMEACSVWQPVFEEMEEKGFDVHLAHPSKVKLIAEARVKTDKIDAKVLAQLLRMDMLPEAYIAPEHIRKLRTIVRHRYSLVRLRASVKHRVHSILHKVGIIIELSDIFGKGGTQFLERVPLKPQYRFALNHYLDIIRIINRMIEETNDYIDIQAKNIPEVQLLKSVHGFGTYSALLIYAEIGDISRFGNYKQLCSYAGITASVYQSGDTVRYGHITKQGNTLLRWILIQAVFKVAKHSPGMRRFHKRLLYKKGKKVAKIALTRKLLVYIYIMLTHNVRFQELRVNSV
jgi:transposase